MIELTGVCRRHGATEVVRDVSLQIPRGGVIALVGANGAGKSTVLSMISRLMEISKGQITLDGDDIASIDGRRFARVLAILRQETPITARLSVEDLVAFGRFPHTGGRLTRDDQGHVDRALETMELSDLRKRFLDQLSGGQRQRALIAMVLCQDTDYILLDEPLNNLDIRHGVAMMKLLRRLADDHGKTVVVVLHDINFASCYADRIIAMRDGGVLCDGTPEAVIRPEVLQDIYGQPMSVHQVGGQRMVMYFR